jgi:hypothetical protein
MKGQVWCGKFRYGSYGQAGRGRYRNGGNRKGTVRQSRTREVLFGEVWLGSRG